MRAYAKILAVALVLIAVVCAMPWKAVAGSFVALSEYAIRYIPSSSIPSNCTGGNVCAWVKSSDNNLYYRNASGNDVQVTAGNSLAAGAFPLTNGTSTNTYTSAVTDGASAVGHAFDTTNAFSTAGDKILSIRDGGVERLFVTRSDATFAGPSIESTGTLGLTNSTQDRIQFGANVIFISLNNVTKWQFQPNFFTPQAANSVGLGIAGQEMQYVTSFQYRGVSQSPAFSATVAVNCTSGETIHIATVNANVTGATMTSGNVGQRCIVVWAKDASGTGYTITWSGSNVRAVSAEAMSTAASSLFIQTFAWDDKLGTPAWVETTSKQTP